MPKSEDQNTSYRLIGRPESGYSMKVRSGFRYKSIDVEWLDRFRDKKLFLKHARVPLIPVLLLPDGSSMQDSTPILEHIEHRYPEPSIHPSDPAVRFLSELIEEYGDEWANKPMFHYRWTYPADQQRRSASLGAGLIDGARLGALKPVLLPFFKRYLIRRMVPRMAFAGANDNNAPLLIESFDNLIEMLDAHLANRVYLFGARPAFGDFGLWGQLYQASLDPTCEAILNKRGPKVLRWIRRMEHPTHEGEFETLEALAPTLRPILEREVGPRFLAWSDANTKAWAAGEAHTELKMNGRRYYQKTFKYPAGTLRELRKKFEQARQHPALVEFLESTGCLRYLESDA